MSENVDISSEGSQKTFSLLWGEENVQTSQSSSTMANLAEALGKNRVDSTMLCLHEKVTGAGSLSSADHRYLSTIFLQRVQEHVLSLGLSATDYTVVETRDFRHSYFSFVLYIEIIIAMNKKYGPLDLDDSVICGIVDSFKSVMHHLETNERFRCREPLLGILLDVREDGDDLRNDKDQDHWLNLSQTSRGLNQRASTSTHARQTKSIKLCQVSRLGSCLLEKRTVENITAKLFLELSVFVLFKELMNPLSSSSCTMSDEDTPLTGDSCSEKRSFLNPYKVPSIEEKMLFGQLPKSSDHTSRVAQYCIESDVMIDRLEELLSTDWGSFPFYIIEEGLAYFENISLHVHALRSLSINLFPLLDLMQAVRCGLSRCKVAFVPELENEKDIQFHEALLQLLRIVLNLANDPGCFEQMRKKTFFNILSSIFLLHYAEKTNSHFTDVIILIPCIYCTLFYKALQTCSSEDILLFGTSGAPPSIIIEWFLQSTDLHCALANLVNAAECTSLSNDLKVASSYCALLIGCLMALCLAHSTADSSVMDKISFFLRENHLNASNIAQKLQEFLVFQSEVGVLTEVNLKNIVYVAEEVLSFSQSMETKV